MVMATRSGDEALESIRAAIAEMNQTTIDKNARTNERVERKVIVKARNPFEVRGAVALEMAIISLNRGNDEDDEYVHTPSMESIEGSQNESDERRRGSGVRQEEVEAPRRKDDRFEYKNFANCHPPEFHGKVDPIVSQRKKAAFKRKLEQDSKSTQSMSTKKDDSKKVVELSDVPIVNEFPDVFPNELPCVPPEREERKVIVKARNPFEVRGAVALEIGDRQGNRGNQQLTRLTRLEFPKFEGWAVYEDALLKRFCTTVEDPLSELKNMRQTGMVRAYYEEYELLLNKVELTHQQMISFFLGGLQKEIELMVRRFNPRSLEDAFRLAKLQEDTIAASKKRYNSILPAPKSYSNSYMVRNSCSTPPSTSKIAELTGVEKQLTLTNTPHNSVAKNSDQFSTKKRLSQKEYEEKRAKNLCFYCDQRYTLGHKCSGQLYALEVMGPEDRLDAFEVQNSEQGVELDGAGYGGDESSLPHISLNALNGTSTYQTMRVVGQINNQKVHILIDSGSTHNFLDLGTGKRLGCRLKTIDPLYVGVPGGNQIVSTSKCEHLSWSIDGHSFSSNMMLLPLGGCEMVLGIQWLETLGNITWNFEKLRTAFMYKGKRVELQGLSRVAAKWSNGKNLSKSVARPQAHFPSYLAPLLKEYDDIFQVPSQLPPKRNCDHIIPLMEGTQPINIRRYPHPPTQKDAIEIMVNELASIEHPEEHLRLVLNTMRSHTLFAKKTKCVFATSEVEYLGHVISLEGVSTDPTKVEAMVTWPEPKMFKQLRGLLGLTGYYRRFIIEDLSRKDAFGWNEEAKRAFEMLKVAMQHAPVLALPNFDDEFVIETDASGCVYKRGSENGAADALSRVEHGNQLFALCVTSILTDIEDKVITSVENDIDLQQLKAKLIMNPASSKHYVITNDRLTRKARLVVGNDLSLRRAIVQHFHNDASGGHSGVSSTFQKVNYCFYWKKLRNFIKQYIRECVTCQGCKADLSMYPGLLQPLPIPECIWTDISMDFIEILPLSMGKTVIFVVVDRLSKYAHFTPLAHPFTAAHVAKAFLDTIYRLHGLPKVIVSDHDKVFLSLVWKELFKLLKTTQKIGLIGYLLPSIGITPISTTQLTPLHMRLFMAKALLNRLHIQKAKVRLREQAISVLKFHLKRAQERMKVFADRKCTDRVFAVNDWVFVKLQPYRQLTLRGDKQHKLSPKYYGPFRIITRIGEVAYKLLLPDTSRIHCVFHVSQLKLYKGDTPPVTGWLPHVSDEGHLSPVPIKFWIES
ncbi:uncharacterized protein [Rutidosis leptorrhynchoides]|uniref:uncharacterized protein n=1 Tax=Rutidosis leptorrhynchoides TaxID=125765 RepID=UPI003A9A03E8